MFHQLEAILPQRLEVIGKNYGKLDFVKRMKIAPAPLATAVGMLTDTMIQIVTAGNVTNLVMCLGLPGNAVLTNRTLKIFKTLETADTSRYLYVYVSVF